MGNMFQLGDVSQYRNWTQEDIAKLEGKTTYTELVKVAMPILSRISRDRTLKVVQVCGPIYTGGIGSLEENLKVFGLVIDHLASEGKIVFDQRPFEGVMQEIKRIRKTVGYAYDLLEEFYGPVFASGYVRTLYFIPGWRKTDVSEGSIGTQWEFHRAGRLGLRRVQLSEELIQHLLSKAA